MHVAATNPASLSEADLDPALVEREKAVLTEQARESASPSGDREDDRGRMKKFFEEVTLLGQKFVINPDLTVAQAAKEAGVEVTGFVRLAVGEGIEKKEGGLRRRGRQGRLGLNRKNGAGVPAPFPPGTR
jgi:elongation factor Ts